MSKSKRGQKRAQRTLVAAVVGSLFLALLAGWGVWHIAHERLQARPRTGLLQASPEQQRGERISPTERQLLEEVLEREDRRATR